MCNLKNNTNQSVHKAETDLQTENTLLVTKIGGGGEGHMRSMELTDA